MILKDEINFYRVGWMKLIPWAFISYPVCGVWWQVSEYNNTFPFYTRTYPLTRRQLTGKFTDYNNEGIKSFS